MDSGIIGSPFWDTHSKRTIAVSEVPKSSSLSLSLCVCSERGNLSFLFWRIKARTQYTHTLIWEAVSHFLCAEKILRVGVSASIGARCLVQTFLVLVARWRGNVTAFEETLGFVHCLR